MKQRDEKRFITHFLSFLLALLGFSACNNEEELREMYGTPIASFTVKGKVVHANDKEKALSDIQIVIHPLPEEYGKLYADTLFTDRNGLFELNSQSMGGKPETLRIIYEELEKNVGEVPLKKGELDVTPKQTEEGKGAWNLGKYEAEVEIEMENDTSTANE